MRLRRISKRAAAMVATMVAAVALPLAAQAPAQAASNGTTGTAAWTPQISPLLPGEFVWRDIPADQRDDRLRICSAASGIACVSIGQGDGKLSIFHLYKCDTRSLSNFIDALAVRNNQTGGAHVRFWGPRYSSSTPPDGVIYNFPDYATYDFHSLDLC
ncbi:MULTISPECIES: hypothetical protein [unclassified Streptomyces]|uniref:hypothetical protein n=1 Tax=unclassified Streptomyces TaxID=2593676 RepID=UPI002E7AA610|nr:MULTISPECIES: hypothetical protein [unclassified Streptomyces]MEE1764024.1 hypothetical protein [Streptomyces sp. SP18BB07]MEE1832043.1 hypothetical protein [Streptomyces sp. SP17KL33]